MRKAIIIVVILLAIAALGVFYINTNKKHNYGDEAEFVSNRSYSEEIYNTDYPEAVYDNKALKISFRYPKGWKPEEGSGRFSSIPEKYFKNDDFFLVKPVERGRDDMTIVVMKEVFQDNMPYGTEPDIRNLILNNVELTSISPSGDQPSDVKNQALCIVKYPVPLKLSNKEYQYLFVYTNKYYIKRIFQTVKFLSDSTE